MKTFLAVGAALLGFAMNAAAGSVTVPLVPGLTLIGAASERQGDYESTMTVETVNADAGVRLLTSADVPDPNGGKPTPVSFNRDVRPADLKSGRTYKYMFSNGEEEFPDSTAMGVSAAVLGDLRAKGSASITLDGNLGGLAGLLTGFIAMMPAEGAKGTGGGYLTATGTIKLVEPKPVPYPMIVNNALVSLSAWHVRGDDFMQDGKSVPVDWYILDEPSNALTLRMAFGKDKLQIVRISYPVANPNDALERALSESKRAVIYGIYFDFNSATIKPQSEKELQSIVAVMKKNPDWVLKVDGHTDSIGNAAQNQDLSARRAAAVRVALIERGIAGNRLQTAGYGASAPKDTNATLEGRARNRRVELTRQ